MTRGMGITISGGKKLKPPVVDLADLDRRIKHGVPLNRNTIPSYSAEHFATEGMGRDEANIDPEERRRRMAVLQLPEED